MARIAAAAQFLLALYLLATGFTLSGADRFVWGIEGTDGRWLYWAAGVLGLLAIRVERARLLWLAALTAVTLGRSCSLVAVGSPTITDRRRELAGAFGWVVLWVHGLLGYGAARWSEAIRRHRLGL